MAAESDCQVVVRDFIAARLAKPTASEATQFVLLMAQICGSASFNLNVATSDTDYFGVYASSLQSVFQLKGPVDTLDSHTPHDICVYELAYFCRLLLKGNVRSSSCSSNFVFLCTHNELLPLLLIHSPN